MKLEDQVASVEQCKKLKELGVDQCGCFSWLYSPFNSNYDISHQNVESLELLAKSNPKSIEWKERIEKGIFSAFTVSELGLMLPDYLRSIGNLEIGKCETDHVSMKRMEKSWWNVSYWNWDVLETPRGDTYLKQRSNHLHQAPTLAQAMADMLIFLMENEFIS